MTNHVAKLLHAELVQSTFRLKPLTIRPPLWMFSVVFFIFFDHLKIHGAPLTKNLRIARSAGDPFGYLTKYGYLSRSNVETGELRSPDEIVQAVRNLQKMAGLPQTGDVDDPKLNEIMSQPRCGIGDNRVRTDPNAPLGFNIAPTKWDKKVITFKTLGYSRNYYHEQQRSDFHRAFNIWKEVADLEFVEVHPHEYADILLSFARYDHRDGSPFDGQGGTLAHAFPPGPDFGGDVHFDDDEPWGQMGQPGTIDLYTVAAHEFGHSLGIYHSEVRDALMFPWYKGYSADLKLHYDDVAAIQTLYGPPRRVQNPWLPPIVATSLPTIATRPPTPPPREIPWITPRPGPDEPPNPCNTDIDAVASVRGEVFAFKGKWFWRFNSRGILMEGRPIKTSYFWDVLPQDLERIDAATYILRLDLIVYFCGDRYWTLKARDLYDTPPDGHHLSRLGLPPYITKIDAALTWRFNDRTYLFTGYDYWRLDNTTRELRIDQGYPKAFDIWQGIPVPIDAALGDLADGSTYFFKGTQIYKFNDRNMIVDPRYPQDIGKMWLNCQYNMDLKLVFSNATGSSLFESSAFVSPWGLTLDIFVLNLYCHKFC